MLVGRSEMLLGVLLWRCRLYFAAYIYRNDAIPARHVPLDDGVVQLLAYCTDLQSCRFFAIVLGAMNCIESVTSVPRYPQPHRFLVLVTFALCLLPPLTDLRRQVLNSVRGILSRMTDECDAGRPREVEYPMIFFTTGGLPLRTL